MKKRLFLCLVLALTILTACKKPTPTPEPPAPPAPTILDEKTLVDGALYALEHVPMHDGVQQQMALLGEHLLVYGVQFSENGSARNHIALLDTATGQVVNGMTTPNTTQVQVLQKGLALLEHYRGKVTILNENLEETSTWQLDFTDGLLALSPDGNTLYGVRPQDGLVVKNLKTGVSRTLLTESKNLYGGEMTDTTLALSYTDKVTQQHQNALLDLATGEILPVPFEGVFSSPQKVGDYWLCTVFGETGKYFFGTENRPYALTLKEKYSTAFFLRDPDRILVKRYMESGMEMTLYHLDGTFLSRIVVKGTPTNLLWWQNGYLFLATDENGGDHLFFWDVGAPASGESLSFSPAYEPPAKGSVVSQELYDRAEALGEKYDVIISIAEQIDDEYIDFSATQELDEALISKALDGVESVLSQFPKNFIPQLRYGTMLKLEIHLAGTVGRPDTAENVSGFDSFSGFTETRAAKIVVVLDITKTATMAQTFCHEMVHVINAKLDFDASVRDDALYSEEAWQKLNPDTFQYANTYDQMPMSYFTDGLDAYFIDLYSRTYAKEDRARMLEHAMVGNSWIFSTPQRKAKLQYLCDCIRDCFDTTGWPEETFWEKAL
ncbi:MAG: hypothetical protein J6K84_01425 [Oscillospiraceae bacterium]|nr:hypothetical protein [Oscillospiraceae bacterium]